MPKATPSKPARRPRLKAYRTEAGFHDSYVVAPSMKEALKAWGARGVLSEGWPRWGRTDRLES